MKKLFFILSLFTSVSLTVAAEELHQGDKIVKNLELEFYEGAKEDGAFISWELAGDWDQFDFNFSQGELENNIFTIKASDYKDFVDGNEGIALTIAGDSKTREGEYRLSMIVREVSDGLEFAKDQLNLDMNVNYILPPPPPLWKRLLIPCIILFALALLIFLILEMTAKFPKGLLQLGRDEVSLKGKKQISVRKELENFGVFLDEGVDVVLVKKRFGSFQGPCIKKIEGCSLERDGMFLSPGSVILPDEDVIGLTDSNGNDILIRYC